jgi:hypothetical protein
MSIDGCLICDLNVGSAGQAEPVLNERPMLGDDGLELGRHKNSALSNGMANLLSGKR